MSSTAVMDIGVDDAHRAAELATELIRVRTHGPAFEGVLAEVVDWCSQGPASRTAHVVLILAKLVPGAAA